MATHAMIDIETLGTEPDSVVLSAGAVKFNPFTLTDPHAKTFLIFLWHGYNKTFLQHISLWNISKD